jgi:Tfp pilus assembly protein PilF
MMKGNAPVMQSLWRRQWLWALFLVAATVLVYHRMWQAGFIWDDDSHLTQNPCIIGPLGFKEIWVSSHAYYYPLVLSTFWVLHKFVGLNPLPYHLLNVLMHAAAAVLLWRVLRQLNVRGAWLGAVLWALHPVMVESVAWVTELKNTQSCLFFLLSVLFFLKADGANSEPQKRRWLFSLSLLSFALAITSKSSTVMLPVVLGLCLWWRSEPDGQLTGRRGSRIVILLAPFFLIAAAASVWTIWEQKFHSGAVGAEFTQTSVQRLAIAGRDIWFYLGKLFWPHPLIFMYPRWKIDIVDLSAFLPLLAAAVGLFFLWWKRNGPLRPIFFAAAYFAVSLFPVLGFFNVYFFRYSFVSDHFQYLASVGPLALAASGIVTFLRSFEKTTPVRLGLPVRLARLLQPALCGLLLMVLGILTWRQTGGYHDVETLWRTTIARNPDCPLAHLNLGVLLKERGQRDDAKAEYLEALKINPDYAEALTTLGVCQAEEKQFEKAIGSFEAAIKSDPNYSPAWYNMGNAFRDKGKSNEAIASYQTALQMWSENQEAHNNLAVVLSQSGRLEEAIAHFREALRLNPNDAGAHNNLGVVLAQQGQLDEAVQQFKEALRLNPAYARAYINLGRGLVRLGRKDEAVQDFKEALRLEPDSGEAKQQLRELGMPVPPL